VTGILGRPFWLGLLGAIMFVVGGVGGLAVFILDKRIERRRRID
jgi:hypothetical protein